jgi:uncharacterized protein with GYD domain
MIPDGRFLRRNAMVTYVMLTRLSAGAFNHPQELAVLGRKLKERVRADCPGVHWVTSYALLGPYDYLDVFEAPDADTATKVSLLIRSLGHAATETWIATPWSRFADLAAGLESIQLPRGESRMKEESVGSRT